MQSYKLNFLFFLCFIPFLLFGQDPYYINYDTKDGLPSSEVYAVEIDSNGILWFATDRGVCSYNGYEFKTYTTNDGLANNTTLTIWKDRKGNYWFPGLDGSLTVYDHKKFYPFRWNDKLKLLFNGRSIANIVWDKNDKIFFWMNGFGATKLFTISEDDGEILQVDLKLLEKNYSKVTIHNISFLDLDGYYIPGNNLHELSIIPFENHYIYRYVSSPDDKKVERKLSIYSKQNALSKEKEIDYILNMFVDELRNLWICTKSGLFKMAFNQFPETHIKYFKNLAISDIKIDDQGNYWITTLENGVLLIPSFNFQVLKQKVNPLDPEKMVVALPLKNNLIFGNSKGEILYVNKKEKLKKLNIVTKNRQFLFGQSIGDKVLLRNIIIKEKSNQILSNNYELNKKFYYLWELSNKDILIIGNIGFTVINPRTHEVKKQYYPNFAEKIISVCETQNTLWLGTTNGLFYMDNENYDSINNNHKKFSLLKSRINGIQSDSFNNLWLSTIGNGLLYKTQDTVLQFTSVNGLNSNFINRSFLENDSTLWVATNNGLNKLIYKCEDGFVSISKIESYNTTDGLLTNFINDITKWKDYIWLATNKGINYFSPNSLSKTAPPPPIILEEITVNDSLLKIDEYPDLNYSQNDLYFKFTGISYRKATDKPFYRYRIMNENTDSTWYYTNNRDVRFNDLQAGKYTFEAAAQNKYGQWSEKPIIYQFSISPHFTRTWWFLILCIIAVISSIVFMVQSRSKRIKLKEEQKRKLQEAELKTKDAELQALRNQMNPHFVFNALNSIQNFVFKNDAKKANYYLSRFSKLMRDGLQFARLKYILLEEEIVFLNTYLELEKMRFPDKFLYNVKVDDHIPINRYYIPPLLFQPILENAVKHAFKNIDYEGSLEIHFEEKIPGEILKITIIDNGEGINPNSVKKHTKSKNKSLGLEIISNQIALLNSEGKDNKASFKIFNRKSIDPQLYGTQAEFIISIKFSEND